MAIPKRRVPEPRPHRTRYALRNLRLKGPPDVRTKRKIGPR